MASPSKRAMFASHMRRLWDSWNNGQFSEKSGAEIREYLTVVQRYFDNFSEEQERIVTDFDTSDESVLSAQGAILAEIESVYAKVRAAFNTRLTQLGDMGNETRAQPHSVASDATPAFDASVIGLFRGEANVWPRFRRAFETHVHTIAHYANEQKLRYLRDALVGRPMTIANNHATGNEQYSRTWRALNDFYNDRHEQQQAYIRELMTIPRIRVATGKTVRELVAIIRELVGMNHQHW